MSFASSLQDWQPSLQVGLHWGPITFHPGACLPPTAIHGTQAAGIKGHLQASAKPPSDPLIFPSHAPAPRLFLRLFVPATAFCPRCPGFLPPWYFAPAAAAFGPSRHAFTTRFFTPTAAAFCSPPPQLFVAGSFCPRCRGFLPRRRGLLPSPPRFFAPAAEAFYPSRRCFLRLFPPAAAAFCGFLPPPPSRLFLPPVQLFICPHHRSFLPAPPGLSALAAAAFCRRCILPLPPRLLRLFYPTAVAFCSPPPRLLPPRLFAPTAAAFADAAFYSRCHGFLRPPPPPRRRGFLRLFSPAAAAFYVFLPPLFLARAATAFLRRGILPPPSRGFLPSPPSRLFARASAALAAAALVDAAFCDPPPRFLPTRLFTPTAAAFCSPPPRLFAPGRRVFLPPPPRPLPRRLFAPTAAAFCSRHHGFCRRDFLPHCCGFLFPSPRLFAPAAAAFVAFCRRRRRRRRRRHGFLPPPRRLLAAMTFCAHRGGFLLRAAAVFANAAFYPHRGGFCRHGFLPPAAAAFCPRLRGFWPPRLFAPAAAVFCRRGFLPPSPLLFAAFLPAAAGFADAAFCSPPPLLFVPAAAAFCSRPPRLFDSFAAAFFPRRRGFLPPPPWLFAPVATAFCTCRHCFLQLFPPPPQFFAPRRRGFCRRGFLLPAARFCPCSRGFLLPAAFSPGRGFSPTPPRFSAPAAEAFCPRRHYFLRPFAPAAAAFSPTAAGFCRRSFLPLPPWLFPPWRRGVLPARPRFFVSAAEAFCCRGFFPPPSRLFVVLLPALPLLFAPGAAAFCHRCGFLPPPWRIFPPAAVALRAGAADSAASSTGVVARAAPRGAPGPVPRLGGSLPRRRHPGLPASASVACIERHCARRRWERRRRAVAGVMRRSPKVAQGPRAAPEAHRHLHWQSSRAGRQVHCVQRPHPAEDTDPGGEETKGLRKK
ncbi:uncharacterized protein LOC112207511 [Pan troglodytes]|uniref:uncharacterized protein LOC112207511 n=1 Tax=Pan troglodytes TaxID=9598 RepID=UPI00301353E0